MRALANGLISRRASDRLAAAPEYWRRRVLTMLDWSPRPKLIQSTSQRRSTAQIFAIVEERVFELGRPLLTGNR